jgi:hypothetical protein
MSSFNSLGCADATEMLGVAIMALGAGLLIFITVLMLRKKPECNCDG